jgi:nitrogen regulatory protein PII
MSNVEQCHEVIHAWEAAGVNGATILESIGMRQWLEGHAHHRDDLPLMPSLRKLLQSDEVHHRTLFSVIGDDCDVDEVIRKTEEIVGDLDQPGNGFLFVLSVSRVKGLQPRRGISHSAKS